MPSITTYYLGKHSQTFGNHFNRAKEMAKEWTPYAFSLTGHRKDEVLNCFLLVRRLDSRRELDWISLFNGFLLEAGLDGSIEFPFSHRIHAVFGVEYKGHTFFLSYGVGHTIVRRLRIATRFGRVVAGNSKDSRATRRLKTFMHQFGGKETEVTIAQGDETSAFRTADDMQTLRSIATTNTYKRPLVATGASGYSFWSPESKQDLLDTLDKLLNWWNKGVHQDEVLASLERFTEVDDQDELEACRTSFEAAIIADKRDEFSAIMPSEYWSATGFTYFPRIQKGEAALDIVPWDPAQVLEVLRDWRSRGNAIEELDIVVHVPEGTHVELCPAINFLSWSQADQASNKTYIWDEGSWFSIDKDWAEETIREAEKIFDAELKERQNMGLPAWSGLAVTIDKKLYEGEDLYVLACEELLASPLALGFHKVLPPKPNSQVELCDIFWKKQYLLFCKHGSSFSPVHEVCGQALHSIKAIKYQLSFVKWFEDKLRTKGIEIRLRRDTEKLRVGIVLAVNTPNRPVRQWSIRSLHCLISTIRELGTYNFDARLYLVEYKPNEPVAVRGQIASKKLRRRDFWKKPKPRKTQ